MTQQGILLVLSGPSGTGKGTVCKELLRSNPNLHYSISATTRAPRAGEINGQNYWFVSREQFQAMLENGELLEYAEVYGNLYGTPRRYVVDLLNSGKDVVLEIDTQGAMQVKEKFPQGVFVYLLPPSLEELAKRIHKRGTDSPESIEKRLSCVYDELMCAKYYNYIVVNDDVSQAVRKTEAIILAEKCRTSRNIHLIDDVVKNTSK